MGCMLSDFKQTGDQPYALLEQLKGHPSIAPLIDGGEMKEYCAHLIPEGGFNAIPQVYGDGWMIVGDSGGFVNAVHREGSNLAMTTGRLAAETVIAAKARRQGMTAADSLKAYKTALDDSFVMKDLQKYRDMPKVLHNNPQFFTTYPELVNRAAQTMFTVDGVDKKTKEKQVVGSFRGAPLPGWWAMRSNSGGPSDDCCQCRRKTLPEPLPGRRGRPHIQIKDADVCSNECRVAGLHLCLPGRPATRPKATARDPDHRRLPGVRQLPRDLHRAPTWTGNIRAAATASCSSSAEGKQRRVPRTPPDRPAGTMGARRNIRRAPASFCESTIIPWT